MKANKLLLAVITGAFFLSACNGDQKNRQETQTVATEGDYAAILPFSTSDARQKHTSVTSDQGERYNITTGLMELSENYFKTNNVAFKESQFLTYDVLDASDYTTGLLGRASDSNPDGLNQSADEDFDTGKGKTAKGVAPLIDIYELDWYSGSELKGISLSMVLSASTKDANNNSVTISEDQLKVFADSQGKKLNSYMRDNFPEISSNTPILIAVYVLSEDEVLPGHYVMQAYCTSNSASFSDVNEEWVLLPSTSFTEKDGDVATQFSELKNGLSGFTPDDVYLIGQGRFKDGALVELNITVNLHAKTAAEAIALSQYISGQTSLFTSTNYELTIDISSDNEHVAVIRRSQGSSDAQTIMLI
ncbi:CamS family sex pheromone protein [Merdibacter massiliensis]|uniref:CamS family sex pheromone protein n=1 Tax=Merdibacter massiliensis TaxID=1871030 RepID=UPI00096A294D|nr:CamS family sex pheromone protein [Merdibacter massiliensis]